MIAINITKFSSQTTHFYASFYGINSYVSLKQIENGEWSIDNKWVFNNMEDSHGHSFIKHHNEKELLKNARQFCKEHFGVVANIIIVFSDNKYSESRTKYINEEI